MEAVMGIKQVKEARKLSKPEHFKMVRQALELTQAEMAAMLGYGSRVRIAELEAGTRKPNKSVVRLLQAYLNGYRPPDWPEKKQPLRITAHEVEPPPLRIKVREGEPVVEHFRIARLPATPENIEKVRSAMRTGLRRPGDIARATRLGLLSVKEALDAIYKPSAPAPKPPVR
jgi:transcriptional regulator with XRE-family HTH domain